MKAGYALPLLHPYALNDQSAEMALAAGFEGLWLPDHLLGVYPLDIWRKLGPSAIIPDADAWLDPFCVAAMFSQKFDTPLGTAVTDSVRRRAIDIARTALTLQHANDQGFIIGIGSGEAESTLPFGYDFHKPVSRLEEFLVELNALLTTGSMPGGPGRTGIPLETHAGRPQVWIAAHGPRMLRLTGQYADGWLPIGLEPEKYGAAFASIRQTAKEHGRKAPIASQVIITMLGASRDALVQQVQQHPLAKMLTLFSPGTLWEAYEIEHPMGAGCRGMVDVIPHTIDPDKLTRALETVPIEMFEKFVLLGNAEEITQQISRLTDRGMEHVVIADCSGIAGTAEQAFDHMPELQKLPALLKRL